MLLRYYHLSTVTSTNTWAKEHAAEFDPDTITAISASEQTQGYGRYARVWHSPKGENLYLSLALSVENVAPFSLCQLAAITLEEFFTIHGISAKIKWPNDLVVNGKKIVGVLTEACEVNGIRFIIVGIGINVNMKSQSLAEIPQSATSMYVEKNQTFSIEAVKEFYVRLFCKRFEESKKNHFADLSSKWQKSLQWMIGLQVNIKTSTQHLQGKVVDLHADGSLCLELADGTRETIHSADVNL